MPAQAAAPARLSTDDRISIHGQLSVRRREAGIERRARADRNLPLRDVPQSAGWTVRRQRRDVCRRTRCHRGRRVAGQLRIVARHPSHVDLWVDKDGKEFQPGAHYFVGQMANWWRIDDQLLRFETE